MAHAALRGCISRRSDSIAKLRSAVEGIRGSMKGDSIGRFCERGKAMVRRFGAVVAICFMLTLVGCVPETRPSDSPVVVIATDGIFTMSPSGSLPAFHYEGEHNRTYIAYYTSDSTVKVVAWDEESGELEDSVSLWSDWGDGDDHAGPSILVLRHQTGMNERHNGKLLVASSSVRNETRLEIRRSAMPESISVWEDPVLLEREALYPTLIELDDGTIFAFYMARDIPNHADRSQCYRTSIDGGDTWSDRTVLFEPRASRRIYGIYCADPEGRRIYAMFNRCPAPASIGSWYKDIY